MSNLPTKPGFSRTPSAWPEPGDERRPSGPRRTSPDRHSHQWDDRDRDRDARDRECGNRSRYAPSGPRSPLPPRSADTYIAGSRGTYHGREYRGYDAREDRRKDWDRDRDRDRDKDRDRGYYRRDDTWRPGNDYSPNRRRGYGPRDSDWRPRDDYRGERHWERGRSRDREDQRSRDREHDRRRASPTYRPVPSLSPRRDYHRGPHSSPRRAPPSYPSRARRSTSPRSTGNRSRRSSPVPHVRPEPADTHPPRDLPRPPRTPSPRKASPSPNQHPRSAWSPVRSAPERQSPETAGHQLLDESHNQVGSASVRVEDQPMEGAAVLDGQMDIEMTTEPLTKGKDRSDNREAELRIKAESPRQTGSPTECQQLIPNLETVAVPSNEAVVTQPYLPTIPRYDAKPRFSAAYESEYNRLEAHRAHAAAECRRCFKASRRAFHEVEMTMLDLRAAQHRRELAEAHRKKAHHGQLGIDAESAVNR